MRGRWLLALLVLACALHAFSFFDAGPHDDDFIVYRYAKNLARGEGLVYQSGERIEGFTTPLWTLLCALLFRLGGDLPALTPWIGLAASALSAWALGDLWLRRFPQDRWPLPALLLSVTPAFAWHAVVGLGTTLLAASLVLWWRAAEEEERAQRGSLVSGLWLALACLLRQECALFLLARAFSFRRKHLLGLLLPLLALLGWTLFRFLYYGRLLPISYSVKKLDFLTDLQYGGLYLLRSTLECGVGLWVLLAVRLLVPSGNLRGLSAGLLLHTLYVLYVGGDYMALGRFFQPTLPLLLYAACIAARQFFARERRHWALGIATLLIGLQWTQRERPQLFGEQRFFVERWQALGRQFALSFPAQTKVAISPIGAVGYHSDLPIVDMLGLTNSRVWLAEPDPAVTVKGHQRYDAEYVLECAPEAIVLFNGVRQSDTGSLVVNPWERTLYQDPRFSRSYQAVQMPIAGSAEPLVFFWRRTVPLPPQVRAIGS